MSSASDSADFVALWQHRPRLLRLAYRMTGSFAEAEDIVQDAWERMLSQPEAMIQNKPGWLTSVVSRLAIDHLRSASRATLNYGSPWLPEPVATESLTESPERQAQTREELGFALLFLLERLTPDQRVVWVLRTSMDMPYADIAEIVQKSAATCRQLFHRADVTLKGDNPAEQPREIPALALHRFAHAFQQGNVPALVSMLADDAIWIGDGGTIKLATSRAVVGADKVVRGLIGLNQKYASAGTHTIISVNGGPATMITMGNQLDSVAILLWDGSKISHVLIQRNPEKLGHVLPADSDDRYLPSFTPEK